MQRPSIGDHRLDDQRSASQTILARLEFRPCHPLAIGLRDLDSTTNSTEPEYTDAGSNRHLDTLNTGSERAVDLGAPSGSKNAGDRSITGRDPLLRAPTMSTSHPPRPPSRTHLLSPPTDPHLSHTARLSLFTSSLLAGGLAGTAVDCLFFPLDSFKTRLQAKQGFWASGGFKGVYRGLGSVVVGSAPGGEP